MSQITKEQIQSWLDAEKGRTRLWLANQCKVAKTTVDGWLSAGRPISGPALSIIAELMGGAAPLNPAISLVTFLRAKELADQQGIPLDQWIEKLMEAEIARAGYKGLAVADPHLMDLKVAEEPGKSFPSTPANTVQTKYPGGRVSRQPRKKA